VLKTKLGQWGYTKNVKRCEVVQILRERAHRQPEIRVNGYTFTGRQRPVDLGKIERHRKRAGLPDQQQSLLDPALSSTTDIACQTLPPSLPTSRPLNLRIPEKLFHDIDIFIKGSFEVGLWSFKGNDFIIMSSTSQDSEIKVLHDFLGDFAVGCHAADAQNFALAGIYWKRAFTNIETLVVGKYHDIILNLIQKINDLNRQGHEPLAALLKEHIAQCGRIFLGPNSPTRPIFDGLGRLDMTSMLEVEERILKQFAELFELYLGHLCYSSFVMMMDGARRRLLQCPWTPFDCLPDISYLDFVFGPTDHRPLDVINLRVEILSYRGMHVETEAEASTLLQRAEMIQNDDWWRFYNLTRGWYFLGSAQYFLRKRDAALQSLSNALRSDDELCKIEEFHIFNNERMIIKKYMEHLRSADWIVERGGLDEDIKCFMGPLELFRCCKAPTRLNKAISGARNSGGMILTEHSFKS
jgi:hypothetical protein